jgi:esterase/lipase superfamily enzyme
MSGALTSKLLDFFNDDVFYNSPEDLYGLDDPELWKMDIVLGTSNWDICFDANLKLSKVLSERNVHHWLILGVMTGRYGRKCFLITYPESNFFRLDSIRKT